MKNTKIANRIFIAILFFPLLIITSCNNDDDKPTTTELLIGTWVLTAIDGADVSQAGLFFELEFDDDGDYKETAIIENQTGTSRGEWELNNDEDEIDVDYDGGGSITWEIEDLNKTEMTLEYDGSDWEFLKDD